MLCSFMNIFQSKFRFSATEHPYYSTIVVIRKEQMSVFSINIMRSLIKLLNMRGPRIEPWCITVEISIHLLIADPIFTLCFRF